MKCASLVLLVAVCTLVACPAFATVVGYDSTIQGDGTLTHRWSFDGADDAARLADGKGSAGLTQVNYGTTPPNVGLGVGGFDATSMAAETKRAAGNAAGAGFHSADFALGSTVTVETLFKPTTSLESGGNAWIVSNLTTAPTFGRGYFLMQRNADGATDSLNTVVGDSFGGNIQTVKSPLPLNHWYFYAGTYATDGSNTTINAWIADLTAGATSMTKVVNGVTVSGIFGTDDRPLGIGVPSDSPADSAFPGLIDEVSIYNAALSGATIQSHLDAIRALPEPSTVALLLTGWLGLIAYAWRKRK
jgi:hypothetical protein